MKLFYPLFLLCLLTAASAQTYKLPEGLTASDYLANTIILKVKPAYRNQCAEQGIGIPKLQNALSAIGATSLVKKFPRQEPPRELYNRQGQAYADLSLIYECKFASSHSIAEAINLLLSSKALVYAEPHILPRMAYLPSDTMAINTMQYHLQTINAYGAWNISKGDTNVIIGITDTGTEPTHPDLKGNIKHNYADPVDGVDNDGDGYIDNFSGWDLGVNDNDPTWQSNVHGVHVSGIASASTDNVTGIAGVGFKCKFLPIKIADASGNLIASYEGIKYAADHGCKVVNCSWGSTGGGQYGQDIVTYATINKDMLVVAAAGNDNADELFYPAAYRYVLSVGNTTQADDKNVSSNFGYFIDVCAPGTNILSTWAAGTYNGAQSGTSMSSPCVAGAIGIVRSYFTGYTAMQAGERLRVTCDNIYAVPGNAPYQNKLGKGRINLFRALNDPNMPSVVYENIVARDRNDSLFLSGDTISFTGLFTNYLAPTAALSATLTSLSAQVTAISNICTPGVIATMASVSHTATPFKFKLSGTFALNAPIDFRLDMSDGTYSTTQYFTIYINPDYINITINDVSTTTTSKGKIGFNQDNQVQGLGFRYMSSDLMYDAGFMIGPDSTRVSDCIRGSGSSNDADFNPMVSVQKITTAPLSNFDTYTKFNDGAAVSPIGLIIEQRNYAWTSAPDRKYVIWEYVITNTTSATINNLYAGICADWDIDNFADNKSAYDAVRSLGYSWCTDAGGHYAGIKLLTTYAPPNFYGIDNVSGGGGGYDISSGFTSLLKYKVLSTQRLSAGNTATTGNDVLNVMSSGPYSINPGRSAVVAFALLAGDNLSDLQASAASAQVKYASVASAAGVDE
ncbi:MAG: S8 family serine peptidase, partial [Bacteroidia bacterium]